MAEPDHRAADIRACTRKLQWDAARRKPLGRARVVATKMTWPARATVAAVKQAVKYGPGVRASHGIPIRRQFAQMLRYSLRHGEWPAYWYKFRLYLPDRAGRDARFLGPSSRLVHMYINEGTEQTTLWDKQAFAHACRERRLPHLPSVAVLRGGRVVEPAAGFSADDVPRADLFLKPADGRNGEGTDCWRWREAGPGAGTYERVGSGGRDVLDPPAMLARLIDASRARPLVIQRRIHNHPTILALTPGPLSTVRVVTLRPPDGEPRVLLAAIRMPVSADKCVDNFFAGGLASPVDLPTGRLGPAIAKNPTAPGINLHPQTGNPITGTPLPFWEEAKALCVRAQSLFPTLATVGWDVAILPDGPVLVEGNPRWCIELAQMPHGVGLCDTDFGEIITRHIARRDRDRGRDRDHAGDRNAHDVRVTADRPATTRSGASSSCR